MSKPQRAKAVVWRAEQGPTGRFLHLAHPGATTAPAQCGPDCAALAAQQEPAKNPAKLTDDELFDEIRTQVNLARRETDSHDRARTRALAAEAKRRGWNAFQSPR